MSSIQLGIAEVHASRGHEINCRGDGAKLGKENGWPRANVDVTGSLGESYRESGSANPIISKSMGETGTVALMTQY